MGHYVSGGNVQSHGDFSRTLRQGEGGSVLSPGNTGLLSDLTSLGGGGAFCALATQNFCRTLRQSGGGGRSVSWRHGSDVGAALTAIASHTIQTERQHFPPVYHWDHGAHPWGLGGLRFK